MKNIFKVALAALATSVAFSAHADDAKLFNGAYVGAELGYADFSGGLDGISYGGFAGGRIQLENNIVLGVEGAFGSADVDYLDHIWSVTGTVGLVVGEDKKGLVYVGGGYTKAKASAFGVSVTGDDYAVKAGYEYALSSRFSVRGQVITAGFDDTQFGLGVLARF
ncbi:outer membrane beta-barrel protein [Kordiimonas pumila]|uniref:Outer membrane beta-barrel protein n=1 Tax=Kordiimonas pumila TaxID=2161677 RepID=A0ABV7D7I9_9PROT|nr:outer membrane beta-barrel protein [Kordiimonas pumila]